MATKGNHMSTPTPNTNNPATNNQNSQKPADANQKPMDKDCADKDKAKDGSCSSDSKTPANTTAPAADKKAS